MKINYWDVSLITLLRLGDPIQVRVDRVDLENWQIDLMEEEKPRRKRRSR